MLIFFLGWIIKKLRKGGHKIIRKRGQGVDVTELKWAGVAPPPHCVDNLLAVEERGGSEAWMIKK